MSCPKYKAEVNKSWVNPLKKYHDLDFQIIGRLLLRRLNHRIAQATCNCGSITCSMLVHLRIHRNRLTTDSVSSFPLVVNLYSTRGGISLYLCLSTIPFFSSSFSLLDSVLVLKPFIACLKVLCLTGFVEQHNGISISDLGDNHMGSSWFSFFFLSMYISHRFSCTFDRFLSSRL